MKLLILLYVTIKEIENLHFSVILTKKKKI